MEEGHQIGFFSKGRCQVRYLFRLGPRDAMAVEAIASRGENEHHAVELMGQERADPNALREGYHAAERHPLRPNVHAGPLYALVAVGW